MMACLLLQAQLARRVREYLLTLKVIDNESTLSQMSLSCEPPPGIAAFIVWLCSLAITHRSCDQPVVGSTPASVVISWVGDCL